MSTQTTTTLTNHAAYLDAPNAAFRIAPAPSPDPATLPPTSIIIRIHAIAINPADYMRQTTGLFIDPSQYPWIIGCDGAGVVVALGSDVSRDSLVVGDRVAALSDESTQKESSRGMFQEYVVVDQKRVVKVPGGMAFEDACVLPLGCLTAAAMLFERETLGLDWLRLIVEGDGTGEKEEDETIVVWGASSSVGVSAVQLARAAGYHVVGIAGSANFDMVSRAGCEGAFDHRNSDIVEEVCDFIEKKGWRSAGVVCAVPMQEEALRGCGEIAKRLRGRKIVSRALPRAAPQILEKLKGAPKELQMPEGVRATSCAGFMFDQDAYKHINQKWMPAAIADGRLKCLPPAEVVGDGLKNIDRACDMSRKGVSGRKLVVKVP